MGVKARVIVIVGVRVIVVVKVAARVGVGVEVRARVRVKVRARVKVRVKVRVRAKTVATGKGEGTSKECEGGYASHSATRSTPALRRCTHQHVWPAAETVAIYMSSNILFILLCIFLLSLSMEQHK